MALKTGRLVLKGKKGLYQVDDVTNTEKLIIPAAYPSTLKSYKQTVTRAEFTDGGATTGTFVMSATIPAGSVMAKSTVTAITGFTGDTSATIQIGDGSTADRYSTGTPSVFTTAAQGVDVGAVSGTAWHTAAVTTVTLTVTTNADFTNCTAGSVDVTLFWYEPV
jgi:hypothetical protein